MRVRVLYFGVLKDVVGIEREDMEVEPGCPVAALLHQIRGRDLNQSRAESRYWSSIAIAVNQEYVPATTVLQDGDEVAFLPPVSGGAGEDRADAR